MTRGKRRRLEEGIYADAYGLSATVKVGRLQRERRWPLDADRQELRGWRVQTRAELDRDRPNTPIDPDARGTLRGDGTKWIARKKGAPAFKADRAHLRAWFPLLGDHQRSSITSADVARVLAAWLARKPPVAARTIRHRCRVLRELYQALDGPRAKTPVDGLSLPKPPRVAPVPVPLTTIRKVARNLKRAGRLKEHARFLVRALTGQRPAQVMRATAADVDLRRKVWWVRPAKGGEPIPFPLNEEAVAAWKLFAAADAWGAFDTARFADVLREHGWPKGVRPYTLRHTFAIDLLLGGADLGDIQGLLGHTQIQTTRDAYAPVLVARLRKVTDRRRLGL